MLLVAIALIGGSAWAGTASRHPWCAGTLLPSLSPAQPPRWSPPPVAGHLAKLFLANCLAGVTLVLLGNYPRAAIALDLNHHVLLFARFMEGFLWAFVGLWALPNPIAVGASLGSFVSTYGDA